MPFKPIPSLGNPKSVVSRKVNLEDDWNFLDELAKIIRNTRISIVLLRYIFSPARLTVAFRDTAACLIEPFSRDASHTKGNCKWHTF